MQTLSVTIAQALALLLLGLLTGSMFAIWRGYPIAGYSPSTFLEVHQGAVRGLNVLLPALAVAALVLVGILAVAARQRPGIMWLYVLVAGLIVSGGLITRLINQPINAQVMTWTATTLPTEWTYIRDRWWTWHQIRLGTTAVSEVLLLTAIFLHRGPSA